MKIINYKKAFLWGVIVLIVHMTIGNLFHMNPLVMDIFKKYEGHPTIKPMGIFGGMANWIMLNVIFSIIFTAILILLYLKLYESIPGKYWKKGLSFGLIIGLIKDVPEAFNQFMMFNYPSVLILVQLVNAILSLIILGIILSLFFNKFKVVAYE